MNNRLFQQAEQFFKPMTDIAALNARTFEALAEKQTGLMAEMWTDGMNYARDLSDKRDMESFYTSQKDFWENMNKKFSSTAQDSFALLTEAQEQMTELMQDSVASADMSGMADIFTQGAEQATEAAQEQTEEAASTAQSATKSASKATQKSQSQTGKSASKAAQAASAASPSSQT